MAKRKREDRSAMSEVDRQRAELERQILLGKRQLTRNLKLAKGFERQKLGRREKEAQASRREADVARIEAEIQALKSIDIPSSAQSHFYKVLLKNSAIRKSPALPVAIQLPPKSAVDTITGNVLARLYNANLVKEAVANNLRAVRDILGLGEDAGPVLKKRKKDVKDIAVEEAAEPDVNKSKKKVDDGGASGDDTEPAIKKRKKKVDKETVPEKVAETKPKKQKKKAKPAEIPEPEVKVKKKAKQEVRQKRSPSFSPVPQDEDVCAPDMTPGTESEGDHSNRGKIEDDSEYDSETYGAFEARIASSSEDEGKSDSSTTHAVEAQITQELLASVTRLPEIPVGAQIATTVEIPAGKSSKDSFDMAGRPGAPKTPSKSPALMPGKRPPKTAEVAKRMILGHLGIRVPQEQITNEEDLSPTYSTDSVTSKLSLPVGEAKEEILPVKKATPCLEPFQDTLESPAQLVQHFPSSGVLSLPVSPSSGSEAPIPALLVETIRAIRRRESKGSIAEDDTIWEQSMERDSSSSEESQEGNPSSSDDSSESDADSGFLEEAKSSYIPPHMRARMPPLTVPASTPLKGEGKKRVKPANLPTLAMGTYWSGSESEASDIEEHIAPRKNRRGQRARQAIWEQKYKAEAKHVKEADKKKQGRDDGWDLKRGATSKGDSSWKKGKGAIWKGRDTSGFSGSNSVPVAARAMLVKKHDDEGPLHPSWEAKKNAKSKVAIVPFQGKKITFD